MSFTIFGLWLVVVQLRRREWAARPQLRWGAQAAAMHFALPGMMSLRNRADPASTLLWRVSFAGFAALGGVAAVPLDGATPDTGALGRTVRWGAVALYAAVALVAMFADLVGLALGVHPLQLEAVLVSLLLFLGLHVAFALLFDTSTFHGDGAPTGEAPPRRRPLSSSTGPCLGRLVTGQARSVAAFELRLDERRRSGCRLMPCARRRRSRRRRSPRRPLAARRLRGRVR